METFCLGLLRAWIKIGVVPTLYVSYTGGERIIDIPVEVKVVSWNTPARKSFFRLARWLRSRPNDPCLAASQELAVVLLLLRKLHLISNTIYYRESTDVDRHYAKWFKKLMRWLWPHLDGIIEQSKVGVETTRQVCGGRLPPCRVVRNIMEKVDVKATFELHDGAVIRLGCIGSFKPMKGQGFLINELKEDKKADWTLTFWGDGERKAHAEQLVADFNMFDRVRFNAWQSDKSTIYESCDIVVIPSDYEGLPNVMLEAILHGKRVSVRPTCVGACELLSELEIRGTWPWRESLKIPKAIWDNARSELSEICNPTKVSREILEFMTH